MNYYDLGKGKSIAIKLSLEDIKKVYPNAVPMDSQEFLRLKLTAQR
ncbi:hypothetical protein NIES4101_53270 [Calothrix sp. NIES-4101]|nr:hypothetical protein NIES4101_53270 [Calothrix sp. NIES-4101]